MQTYEEIYSQFRWPQKQHYNFARDVIDRWAEKFPSKRAMLWVDEAGNIAERSFSQISDASKRFANVLMQSGVKRGDVVIIILSRQIAWWEVKMACLRAGVVISPGTTQLSSKDIAYRIHAAKAVAVITDSANADKVDNIAKQCPSLNVKFLIDGSREGWLDYTDLTAKADTCFVNVNTHVDDEALLYFTSGTTGYPKMTVHCHGYPMGHETTARFWLDIVSDDLHWNISDTGWAKAAWSSYFGPWLIGSAVFVHHTPQFDAEETLEILQKHPITTMCGAPTIYRLLVQQDLSKFKPKTLRHCVAAGEPLNPEVIEVWKNATGLIIRDGYGQTETVILCGNFSTVPVRYGSMGKPAPGIDLNIVDNAGQPVGPNEEGHIAVRVSPVRPYGLFKEYKNDPKSTALCYKGDWYLTGDRAYKDEDGYFWFVSRTDDVILSAGYRIGPFEVESALLEHEAVVESAVVAKSHPVRGDIVKAFIVLAKGVEGTEALKSELQTYVKTVTAPYKYPREIEFIKTLPKTVSGKIHRIDLRARDKSNAKITE
ncbi:MAG: acyl-CoA synthetase [Robiginitomaculum sp.]|nr:MAG: acyl-CoA synthetase [Robiginitomaculum sp.]